MRSSADLQLYDSEFQTEGALTQNTFADNVGGIRGTTSISLSGDRRVRVGWYSWMISDSWCCRPMWWRHARSWFFVGLEASGAFDETRWHWQSAGPDRPLWLKSSEQPAAYGGCWLMYRAAVHLRSQVATRWCCDRPTWQRRVSAVIGLYLLWKSYTKYKKQKSAKRCKVLVCAQANNELFNVTESKVI